VDTVQSATLSLNLASHSSVENIGLLGSLPLTATGNAGLNLLDGSGNSAANVLAGLGGDDVYIVGAGDTVDEAAGGGTDTVFARASHTLKAGAEVEALVNGTFDTGLSLTGNALPQRIQGNGGNDTLSAGGGGGLLIGGAGTDTLIGGVGADMFVFGLFSNSVPGPLRDVIQAFNGAEGDRIDISGMDTNDMVPGNQAFSFLGTSPFTGANGEVRYVASGPDLIVQGVQFPGVTFEIRVAGLGALSAGDFVL
jgi:Ca2+-binding RTX toxin-like protein